MALPKRRVVQKRIKKIPELPFGFRLTGDFNSRMISVLKQAGAFPQQGIPGDGVLEFHFPNSTFSFPVIKKNLPKELRHWLKKERFSFINHSAAKWLRKHFNLLAGKFF